MDLFRVWIICTSFVLTTTRNNSDIRTNNQKTTQIAIRVIISGDINIYIVKNINIFLY